MDTTASQQLRDLQRSLQQAVNTIDLLCTLDQMPSRAALVTALAVTQHIEQSAQLAGDALTGIARNQTPPIPLADLAQARNLSINGLRSRLTRMSTTIDTEPWEDPE